MQVKCDTPVHITASDVVNNVVNNSSQCISRGPHCAAISGSNKLICSLLISKHIQLSPACYRLLVCCGGLQAACQQLCCVTRSKPHPTHRSSPLGTHRHRSSSNLFQNIPTSTSFMNAGDRTHRRHQQREEKALADAAVLQAAVEDADFASSISDIEASFSTKFQDFIAGKRHAVRQAARSTCHSMCKGLCEHDRAL